MGNWNVGYMEALWTTIFAVFLSVNSYSKIESLLKIIKEEASGTEVRMRWPRNHIVFLKELLNVHMN